MDSDPLSPMWVKDSDPPERPPGALEDSDPRELWPESHVTFSSPRIQVADDRGGGLALLPDVRFHRRVLPQTRDE